MLSSYVDKEGLFGLDTTLQELEKSDIYYYVFNAGNFSEKQIRDLFIQEFLLQNKFLFGLEA